MCWCVSTGGSPNYGGGGVVLGEEYSEGGAEGGGGGGGGTGGGGSLPAFSARFGGAFACATSRPNTAYGAAPPYSHQVSILSTPSQVLPPAPLVLPLTTCSLFPGGVELGE